MVTERCPQLLGFRVLWDTGRLGEGSPGRVAGEQSVGGTLLLADRSLVLRERWAPAAGQGPSPCSEGAEELIWAMHQFARLVIQRRA